MITKNLLQNFAQLSDLVSNKLGGFDVLGLPYNISGVTFDFSSGGLVFRSTINQYATKSTWKQFYRNDTDILISQNSKKIWTSKRVLGYTTQPETNDLLVVNVPISISFNQVINIWAYNRNFYQRFIVEITHIGSYQNDIGSAFYCKDSSSQYNRGLIQVKVANNNFIEIYPYKYNNTEYLILETNYKCAVEDFLGYVRPVEMTMNLLCGLTIGTNLHIFSSPSPDFSKSYYSYKRNYPIEQSNYSIFTTNMLWMKDLLETRRMKYALRFLNTRGEFNPFKQDWLHWDQISNIIILLHADEDIERSLYVVLTATRSPLEYQSALLCVALETISNLIIGKTNKGNVLEKNEWKNLRESLLDQLPSTISKDQLDILTTRINNLNGATNQQALSLPFELLGYKLSKADKEILKKRNNYLHGRLNDKNMDVEETFEERFERLHYEALMFHKLYCILLLKYSRFKGYILNNPVIMKTKTAVKRKENPLIKL